MTSGPRRTVRSRLRQNGYSLLIIPNLIFLSIFFLLPLAHIVYMSFTEPTLGINNYRDFFADDTYRRVLLRTILISAGVAVITAIVAFPYSVVMHKVGTTTRLIMLAAVMVPFWVSLMVRTYAWLALLQDHGAVNQLLALLGIGPFPLIRNIFGLTLSMVQILLPFMVLPLYATVSKIDPSHMKAALSLGATPVRAFFRVYLPLSKPGLLAGAAIVFIVSLGFYITPQLLGSPQQSMLSQLAVQQTTRLLNLGMASTMATVLLVTALLVLALSTRFIGGSLSQMRSKK